MIKYSGFTALSLIAFFSLTSCLKKDTVVPPQQLPPAIFIIQASPDAPNVDFYINGSIALQNIAYGTDSGYFFTAPGNNEIKVRESSSATFFATQPLTLAYDKYYSIFSIDKLSSIKIVAVEDNFSAPASDSVQLRYLDFSPDAPYHNAEFVNSTDAAAFTGRGFNDQAANTTNAVFKTVKAGTYNLELKQPGNGTAFTTITNIVLTGGKVYTVYLKGLQSGTGTQELVTGMVQHL